MDKLFNNKCELDDREYFKIDITNIDESLIDYKDQINKIKYGDDYLAEYHIRAQELSENNLNESIIAVINKDTDYKNFNDLFEQVYRSKLNAEQYNVFISGGLDSTTLYSLLKSKDIAFKPHCIRYKSKGIVFNDYEIKNVPDDTNIIDFDILDFFDSGKFLETAQKYHCVSPQLLPLLKGFEMVDGPILETSTSPNGFIKGNVYEDRLNSKYLTYRYALDLRNDNSIFNFYRSHHYIDKLSLDCYNELEKKYGRDISKGTGADFDDEEYNIKQYLYQNIFSILGKVSNKFTGFEALKVWYADKYIGNDPYLQVFDQHFRQTLKQRNVDKFKDQRIICILREKQNGY